ncbi:MAG: PKD domain-containing protein, partial [Bacteroidetes bacterium]
EAECAGYGPDIYYACDGGCICPEFYSPVCVIDDSGDTLTFDNYCFAECEGYGPDQWLDFEIDPCNCPDDLYDPVCVHTPAGRILFNNACEAECAGFEPGMYQPCDGDCACPEIYDPVCVWDSPSGAILSFDNFCLAQCAGYGPDQWVACEPNECDCPEDLYDPVCVTTDAGTTVNFPNPCYAECAGYTPDQWQPCVPDCVCPDYLDPVCVLQDDGTEIEFPNACMALCQGYSPTDWVYCGTEPCDCPQDVYDPVCVQGPISIVEFINACEAECAGFGEDDFLDNCPQECQCEEVHDPVCVVLEDGVFFFFINACEARCAGFTDDQFGPCQPECDCPGLWAPVCVVTPDGAEIRFANACEAECAGYGADEIIECEDTGCECEEFYFPVCVLAASGELLEFLNPCEALCAGYGSDQIIECDRGQNCHADFTFDFLTDDGLSVQFHDLSLLEGGTSSWFWDFGDGHTSTEPAPVHTFEAPGLYDVVLTVSNDTCGTLAITQHLCVGEGGGVPGPDCQAFFFLEQPDPDNLLTFQFLNLSVGEGTAYVWDFGDGTTSTQVNPLHTYAVAGIYTVSLTVLGENCDHTVSVPINAGENIWYGNLECRAWFLPIMEAESNAVFLVNLSTPDAVSFAWDFGDGTSSDHASAYHQYEGPGTYTVSLTITTAEGCSSTFSATLNFGQGDFHPAPPFTLINNTEDSQATGPVDVRAWPNPTNALVTINWRSSTSADTWQLFNLNGQRLRSGTVIPVKGEGRLPLDLADLPDGIYLFRLQTTDGVETLRLSKF